MRQIRVTAATFSTYHGNVGVVLWNFRSCEVVPMAEPVRCDVCGKLYSSRHLSSHKRLAHPKPKPGSTSHEDRMKAILELFRTLSLEHKKRVLAQLAADAQKAS